jgi:hypothetical protein
VAKEANYMADTATTDIEIETPAAVKAGPEAVPDEFVTSLSKMSYCQKWCFSI